MEEQILKIIDNRINTYLSNPDNQQKENAAKEITEHVMEFMEWVFKVEGFFGDISEKYLFVSFNKDLSFETLEEVYQYWLKEIKRV
jgi:hypothetical protein